LRIFSSTRFYIYYIFFFFFQAEDGIRDFHVTGVQTCALPILPISRMRLRSRYSASSTASTVAAGWRARTDRNTEAGSVECSATRSEERRVGKESRSRWGADQQENKRNIAHSAHERT